MSRFLLMLSVFLTSCAWKSGKRHGREFKLSRIAMGLSALLDAWL